MFQVDQQDQFFQLSLLLLFFQLNQSHLYL
jgi:hypothetical protein